MGHNSSRGTAAADMVHSVLADADSYGVFGMSNHTDSYIWTNNQRVKKRIANICNTTFLRPILIKLGPEESMKTFLEF